ncbi:hypothetical protein BD410DRAFT_817258 [Rickenella mellea]|uniref:Alpha-ketoglutarate-dependent dioxygenase AlkB-like domain-containing protein n=1 Tax=Rickenella mellea TaxID=50990 RepID=A0A4Y7PG78_9AGAM|nr:hypothetical protein BD410DRAFT_817258 [Rickenella mellea]
MQEEEDHGVTAENGIAVVLAQPGGEENRVFGVLAGRPPGSDWDEEVVPGAYWELDQTKDECKFDPKDLKHRRGRFPVQATGISYGGGQEVSTSETKRLLASPSIIRIAGYANYAFQTWAPRLYDAYVHTMDELYARNPQLRPNFDNSIFASATINFGPSAACFPHVDELNMPYRWCAITALGDFDPARGGHLVLWDLKMIIEFPAGSTILIPSATIRHSNIPV